MAAIGNCRLHVYKINVAYPLSYLKCDIAVNEGCLGSLAGRAGYAVLLEAQQSCIQFSSLHNLLDIAAALTLTEAERAGDAKQLLNRRSRYLPDEAQICSDGFIIGLAFLLEVLNTLQPLPDHRLAGFFVAWKALLEGCICDLGVI